MKTSDELISEIESRVRPTIATTFTVRDDGPSQSLEGRISQVDFDTIIRLYRSARDIATKQERERCAALHESINSASDDERFHGHPGAGAMGAIIEYRDLIRAA
jgi:hypothetical protein